MLGRQTWLRSGKRTGVGVSGRAKLRRILGYDDRSGSLAHFAACWRWAEKADADVATALQARTMTRLDYKCSATAEYDSCMLCYILDFHLTNTLYILLSSYTKLVLLLASGTISSRVGVCSLADSLGTVIVNATDNSTETNLSYYAAYS